DGAAVEGGLNGIRTRGTGPVCGVHRGLRSSSGFSSLAACGIFGCGIRSRFRLQIGTVPGNDNMRAAFDEIIERQFGAAALQKALSDKDAESHMAGLTSAGREVGLAEATEQMGGKAGPVIGHR